MAVLLQEMLQPELSFVLHTQNPMDRQALAPNSGQKPSHADTRLHGQTGDLSAILPTEVSVVVHTQKGMDSKAHKT